MRTGKAEGGPGPRVLDGETDEMTTTSLRGWAGSPTLAGLALLMPRMVAVFVSLALAAVPAQAASMYRVTDYGVLSQYSLRDTGIYLDASGKATLGSSSSQAGGGSSAPTLAYGTIALGPNGYVDGPVPQSSSSSGGYSFHNPSDGRGDPAVAVDGPNGSHYLVTHLPQFVPGLEGGFSPAVYGSAINSSGELVGYVSDAYPEKNGNAIFWKPAFAGINQGWPKLIPPLAGFDLMTPTGINASGTIVGTAFAGNSNGLTSMHAFVSDGTTVTDLNTLLAANPAGLLLNSAVQIGDAGQIVGYATDGQQNIHAVLLTLDTVPEPTVLSILAVAVAVAAFRGRANRRGVPAN